MNPNNQTISSTILVVDDTPANLRLLSGMLSEQGYKVRPAPNGELALRSAQASPPDLILLDINMPGLSGYEVCQQLKKSATTHAVPVIFISALDDIEDKVKAFSQGGVDYITKPFQIGEVLARVDTHLTLRSLQKQLEGANQELEAINHGLEKRVEQRTEQLVALNRAYERFLPGEFLSFLKKESVLDIELGDQVQQTMTVLFSDIRDFTTISENMDPQESFNFLNGYLRQVSPIIRQYDGFVDKYLGDGIMALFPETADNAIQATIEMQREAWRYNQQQRPNTPSIRIGAGLHTGSVMLGIIGENQRLQGTVISDAVNLAARLEGLTARYSLSILISKQSLMQLPKPNKYHHRFLGQAKVKGKTELVLVYEIFDSDPQESFDLKLQTKERFENGVQNYLSGNLHTAKIEFEAVINENPNDKVTQFYRERLQTGFLHTSESEQRILF